MVIVDAGNKEVLVCHEQSINCHGIAVYFALVKRLGGILPKAFVGVVKYGCINISRWDFTKALVRQLPGLPVLALHL